MSVKQLASLQASVVRAARAHFIYVGVFAALIVVSDAWHLITPSVVLQRWTVAAIMLIVIASVWYAARGKSSSARYYHWLVCTLVVLDTLVASYVVFTTRGIASRGVALFAIPIITAAVLRSRVAPFAAAAFATAAYTTAGIAYFVVHPGEAYKVELYAELGFYSALFFVMAALLWTVNRAHK